MIRTKYIVSGLAVAALISTGTIGIVNAESTTKTVGKSGIPRATFRQDRLNAVAEALNTTTANVQTARKNNTVDQLVTKAGLTEKTLHQKVKQELTSDLESQGYNSDQIIIALQHRVVAQLRHRE